VLSVWNSYEWEQQIAAVEAVLQSVL